MRSTHAINGVCAFNCFVSLADIQQANPDAMIISIGVSVGHGPDGTFYGNTDALTLGINGNTTVYSFEPATPANEQCKNGGWTTFTSLAFGDQGACVSYFASAHRQAAGSKSRARPCDRGTGASPGRAPMRHPGGPGRVSAAPRASRCGLQVFTGEKGGRPALRAGRTVGRRPEPSGSGAP
ncbi:MAG: hypothetical protein ACYCVZ_05600 [Streptosporangiaceae bacterium]